MKLMVDGWVGVGGRSRDRAAPADRTAAAARRAPVPPPLPLPPSLTGWRLCRHRCWSWRTSRNPRRSRTRTRSRTTTTRTPRTSRRSRSRTRACSSCRRRRRTRTSRRPRSGTPWRRPADGRVGGWTTLRAPIGHAAAWRGAHHAGRGRGRGAAREKRAGREWRTGSQRSRTPRLPLARAAAALNGARGGGTSPGRPGGGHGAPAASRARLPRVAPPSFPPRPRFAARYLHLTPARWPPAPYPGLPRPARPHRRDGHVPRMGRARRGCRERPRVEGRGDEG